MGKILSFLFIAFLFAIFFVNSISAVEISFFKESKNFSQGETIIFKVSGNFIDQITRENILFFKDSVRIPFEFNVVKISNDFYVYASSLFKNEGNYSFEIIDVRYYKGIVVSDEKIKENFTINSKIADFSINPAAINTNTNFFIEITNLKDKKIDIEIKKPKEIFLEESKISLNSGATRKLNFIPLENSQGLYFIEFKSSSTNYKIPIFIKQENKTTKEEKFEFQPKEISILMPTNSTSKRIIYLVNLGEKIEEINFLFLGNASSFLKLVPDKITELEENETKKIELLINSDFEEKNLSATILANSNSSSSEIKVFLSFIKDFVENETEENASKIVNCKDINGEICKEGFKCTGEITYVKDGPCCLSPAVCKEIEKKSNKGKVIGWVILIVIILMVILFYKKYKGVRR
ncbi:MAG: hypothetical protein KatS3mg001_441 [Candidatus Pacearchaeota archaeon]|nr:MAG: hypothetical protein KatS3mg001_441 [Candidatus Pacearchaeota archaeon]